MLTDETVVLSVVQCLENHGGLIIKHSVVESKWEFCVTENMDGCSG